MVVTQNKPYTNAALMAMSDEDRFYLTSVTREADGGWIVTAAPAFPVVVQSKEEADLLESQGHQVLRRAAIMNNGLDLNGIPACQNLTHDGRAVDANQLRTLGVGVVLWLTDADDNAVIPLLLKNGNANQAGSTGTYTIASGLASGDPVHEMWNELVDEQTFLMRTGECEFELLSFVPEDGLVDDAMVRDAVENKIQKQRANIVTELQKKGILDMSVAADSVIFTPRLVPVQCSSADAERVTFMMPDGSVHVAYGSVYNDPGKRSFNVHPVYVADEKLDFGRLIHVDGEFGRQTVMMDAQAFCNPDLKRHPATNHYAHQIAARLDISATPEAKPLTVNGPR